MVDAKEEFAALLEHGKKSRRHCECPTEGLFARELRLSSMFSYREEGIVSHDLATRAKLKKKFEKPDKVYGLRQVGTLLKLLRAKVGDDESCTLEERLNPTLFPHDLKPQVFPFLLLEAKSQDHASFERIDNQTGLMIHKCLAIQQRLRDATSSVSQWIAGPLCWYISSIGASWRIAAGYAVESSRIDFEVANLWVGRIDESNGALQLLLIADYICDWARNVHREAMIRSLHKLATASSLNDVASLQSFDRLTVDSYHDKRDTHHSQPLGALGEDASQLKMLRKLEKMNSWESIESEVPLEDPFRRFDSHFGAVRNAERIHTRFMGLYITRTNLPLLCNCTDSDRESKAIMNDISKHLETEEPLIMDQSSLVDLEKAWTGHNRTIHEDEYTFHEDSEEEFHVLLTFSSRKRSFRYYYVTQKIGLADGQTITWNTTHDIEKRGAAQEGAGIIAYMGEKLLYDQDTSSEELSDAEDEDYEPTRGQDSDGDSSEYSVLYGTTEFSEDERGEDEGWEDEEDED
ncbi:Uu.00g142010.m01.CDS01 [Anthostomella pinea]|uniref:Uu.00g142010.m01.CDS01 n=1 Tax=Anthostomella pinea TaxID=933095 RepID=A0AAI8VJX5_9PEZI|nr:Uu.00g142010.m01.CDS01 [Anthostomella pinea]